MWRNDDVWLTAGPSPVVPPLVLPNFCEPQLAAVWETFVTNNNNNNIINILLLIKCIIPRHILPECVLDSWAVPHCADKAGLVPNEEAKHILQVGIHIPILSRQPSKVILLNFK